MSRFLLTILLLAIPLGASAEPAPSKCADEVFKGEMPDVDASHSDKAHVLCFSRYAVYFSGVTKTRLWSAEHLTATRVRKADKLVRPNLDPFYDETQLPTHVFKAVYDPRTNSAAACIVRNVDNSPLEWMPVSGLKAFTGIDVFPKLPATPPVLALPDPEKSPHKCKAHESH